MDYYHILGIQQNATESDIKKAWRELSFKYHPDKHVNASDSQKKENDKKIKELNEAYETLKDPSLRRQYDNRHANPFQQMFGDMFKQQQAQPFRNPYQQNPMMNIFDIINEIHNQQGEPIIFTTSFDGHPMKSPQTPSAPPQPIEIKVSLTLEESFTGTQIPIMIEREIKNGNGHEKFSYREQERIYVTIPPGIDTDEIITIPEKGSEHNGVKGDIKVQITLKPHEVFERKGLNLIYKHNISFKESIVGFDFVLI